MAIGAMRSVNSGYEFQLSEIPETPPTHIPASPVPAFSNPRLLPLALRGPSSPVFALPVSFPLQHIAHLQAGLPIPMQQYQPQPGGFYAPTATYPVSQQIQTFEIPISHQPMIQALDTRMLESQLHQQEQLPMMPSPEANKLARLKQDYEAQVWIS